MSVMDLESFLWTKIWGTVTWREVLSKESVYAAYQIRTLTMRVMISKRGRDLSIAGLAKRDAGSAGTSARGSSGNIHNQAPRA